MLIWENMTMETEKNSKKQVLPDENEKSRLAEIFKVFGDLTRIKILYTVFNSELCVSDISSIINVSQSATSHQLKNLKINGLIKSRREGKEIYYSLCDEHVRDILGKGMEHIREE